MSDTPAPVILDTPQQRMDFLKAHNAPEGFYLVSTPEMTAISRGTSKLNATIRNWQTLSQAVFGVSTPEEALEVVKRQAVHRKGIMDDRMRFREALMTILTRSRKMMPDSDVAELGNIARDAINNR